MKRLIAALVALVLVLVTGCGALAEERKTIAYSTLGVDSDYWYLMERGVAQAC